MSNTDRVVQMDFLRKSPSGSPDEEIFTWFCPQSDAFTLQPHMHSTSCSTVMVVQSLFLLPGLYVACRPITSTVTFSLSVATQVWATPP